MFAHWYGQVGMVILFIIVAGMFEPKFFWAMVKLVLIGGLLHVAGFALLLSLQ